MYRSSRWLPLLPLLAACGERPPDDDVHPEAIEVVLMPTQVSEQTPVAAITAIPTASAPAMTATAVGTSTAAPNATAIPPSTATVTPEVMEDPPEADVVVEPVAATLTLNPNGTTPLAALIQVDTEVETTAELFVQGDETWTTSLDTVGTQHRLPLLGLKADHHYDVRVRLTAPDGQRVFESDLLPVDTAPLPADMPRMGVLTSMPSRMEPGHTMFSIRLLADYQVIVDANGEVIWYYIPTGGTWDIRQLPDGQLLLQDAGSVLVMDLLGNISVHLEPDVADAEYHHEVSPSSNGTFWTLGNRTVTAEAFPTNYDDLSVLETVDVTDDILIELDPQLGVLQRIFLRDVLDPQRIAYDSLNTHPELGTPRDWAHSNAIIEVDDGANLIISCRHQDAVIKMKRDGSELIWILGPHDNWSEPFQQYLLSPLGEDFTWNYHQHAPELTPGGGVLIFDNANYQASPSDGREPVPDERGVSRAVEFMVDESAMTVEQVWEYTYQDHRYYAAFVGDADLQPNTNNVLVVYGILTGVDDVSSAEMQRGVRQTRIVEVDRDLNDEVVFELEVYSEDPEGPGYFVYRAERIAPLR